MLIQVDRRSSFQHFNRSKCSIHTWTALIRAWSFNSCRRMSRFNHGRFRHLNCRDPSIRTLRLILKALESPDSARIFYVVKDQSSILAMTTIEYVACNKHRYTSVEGTDGKGYFSINKPYCRIFIAKNILYGLNYTVSIYLI